MYAPPLQPADKAGILQSQPEKQHGPCISYKVMMTTPRPCRHATTRYPVIRGMSHSQPCGFDSCSAARRFRQEPADPGKVLTCSTVLTMNRVMLHPIYDKKQPLLCPTCLTERTHVQDIRTRYCRVRESLLMAWSFGPDGV